MAETPMNVDGRNMEIVGWPNRQNHRIPKIDRTDVLPVEYLRCHWGPSFLFISTHSKPFCHVNTTPRSSLFTGIRAAKGKTSHASVQKTKKPPSNRTRKSCSIKGAAFLVARRAALLFFFVDDDLKTNVLFHDEFARALVRERKHTKTIKGGGFFDCRFGRGSWKAAVRQLGDPMFNKNFPS